MPDSPYHNDCNFSLSKLTEPLSLVSGAARDYTRHKLKLKMLLDGFLFGKLSLLLSISRREAVNCNQVLPLLLTVDFKLYN